MHSLPVTAGGSTFPFMWQEPALDSLRRLQRHGLVNSDILLAPGHLWPDLQTLRDAVNLRRRMEAEGLSVDSLSLPALDFNLCSCLAEVRKHGVDTYRSTIELAAQLGARGVGVVPGRVSALIPPALDDTIEWLGDSLAQLADAANRAGLQLFVETHPHTPLPVSDGLAAFLRQFGRKELRMAYDIATAAFVGEDYAAMLVAHADILGQVHLSDTPKGGWKHDALGTGIVDVARSLEALRQAEFRGVTIIEIISRNAEPAIAQSMQILVKAAA